MEICFLGNSASTLFHRAVQQGANSIQFMHFSHQHKSPGYDYSPAPLPLIRINLKESSIHLSNFAGLKVQISQSGKNLKNKLKQA